MDLADGDVERACNPVPRVRRVEHRDVEVVEEGLGLVAVDDDGIVSLADEARLDRVGEHAGAFDALGAELAGRLAAELLRGDRRFAHGQRVELASDRELDVHHVEPTPSCARRRSALRDTAMAGWPDPQRSRRGRRLDAGVRGQRPPLEPVHELTVRHGAYSQLRLTQRAGEIVDEFRELVSRYRASDEPMVRLLAVTWARVEAAAEALEKADGPEQPSRLERDLRAWVRVARQLLTGRGSRRRRVRGWASTSRRRCAR